MINRFYDTEIYIRTFAEKEGYDLGNGRADHIASCHGVKDFINEYGILPSRINNMKSITGNYYLGHITGEEVPGFSRIKATKAEEEIWLHLMDAYSVWNPMVQRYAVGGVFSVKHHFDKLKSNFTNYVEN